MQVNMNLDLVAEIKSAIHRVRDNIQPLFIKGT